MDDQTQFVSILQNIAVQQSELQHAVPVDPWLQEYVEKVSEEISSHPPLHEHRNSLLDIKLQALARYLSNLALISMKKMSAPYSLSSTGPESVLRVAELRTVLEKIRPIESKLQYMLDKLLRSAETAQASNDPISYKPRPEFMEDKPQTGEGSSSEASSDEDGELTKSGEPKVPQKYIPPKLAEVHYFENKKEAAAEKYRQVRKAAISRGILNDLKFSDGMEQPEEISETALTLNGPGGNLANRVRRKLIEQHEERVNYEEDRMLRLTVTKKDKKRNKALANLGVAALETVADFREYEELLNGSSGPRSKKGKGKKFKGGKKASRKRKIRQ